VQQVEALTFHRFMATGRTSPALMTCMAEDASESEYVVKLKASQSTIPGLLCELLVSELADHFDIDHPGYALVHISLELAQLLESVLQPDKAALFSHSVGMNFGSIKINNLATIPQNRSLSPAQLEAAANIFAFDVLIQNPDRRKDNPNVGTVGEMFEIYDHELAFSFRQDIIPVPESWRASRQPFCVNHVFFAALHQKQIPLDQFTERLKALPPTFVEDLVVDIPQEWHSDDLGLIADYLRTAQANASEFTSDLLRRLR
jgi:hypothetical protein